ncbi:hypothetical protein TWF173_004460 [Orbilia oligospora]|nr:hypothetical protein TWF173_004460 [Orbilia oligospora]
MSPIIASLPQQHQQLERGVPPPPPPPPAEITGLDAIIGVGITVGALFFLLLMAVITPKIIRHRREVLTRKRREELEVLEKRRARVSSGSGGSGSGSGGEKSGISRAGSEVSRDTVEGKEEVVERGRSRAPRPLPAVGARPSVGNKHPEQCFESTSPASEKKTDITK